MASAPSDRPFTCGSCEGQFRTSRSRDRHCAQADHPLPGLECDTCPLTFDTDADRWRHMAAANHFRLRCDECDLTWPTQGELFKHKLDDHEHWHCPACDIAIPTTDDALYEVQAHMEDVHGFQCRWCKSVWATNEAARSHEEKEHQRCRVCRRQFKNADELAHHQHERKHARKPAHCPFCTYGCDTAAGVVHHMERGACPVVPGVDPLLFWILRGRNRRIRRRPLVVRLMLAFSPRREVARRVKRCGRDGRAWVCYACKGKFGSKTDLRIHLAFVCLPCEFAYAIR